MRVELHINNPGLMPQYAQSICMQLATQIQRFTDKYCEIHRAHAIILTVDMGSELEEPFPVVPKEPCFIMHISLQDSEGKERPIPSLFPNKNSLAVAVYMDSQETGHAIVHLKAQKELKNYPWNIVLINLTHMICDTLTQGPQTAVQHHV